MRETQDIAQTQREKRSEWVCDQHCGTDRGWKIGAGRIGSGRARSSVRGEDCICRAV